MRVKAFLLLILTLLLAAALSSCALLPEEEETRSAPVLRTYETKAFNLAVVERGDLIQTQKVSSQYMPVQTAALCFELGGEYVDKMLVQLGDTVEKGQLLGQLQIGNLEEQIYNARSTIDELQIQIRYLTAQRELDVKRFEIESQNMDPEARAEREKEIQENFRKQLSSLNQSVSMQEMTLKDLERKLAERRIVSPIDGTVTYVKEFEDGEMSVYASHVLTVADSSNSMFRAETKYWHLFESGDEYDIVANKKTYRAVVASEEELGIEAQEKVMGKNGYVYFVLTEPAFELEAGDRGSMEIVVEQRLDVLNVPQKAIFYAGDQAIVYYQREDGMKSFKPVEIGVTIEGRTEILGGLAEGESIILD